ncbi:MAG: LysM peptidoglycan-binding domain-containing protein [Anaerolineales bacterium]|jgi:nucleoid-associated protein YgaU
MDSEKKVFRQNQEEAESKETEDRKKREASARMQRAQAARKLSPDEAKRALKGDPEIIAEHEIVMGDTLSHISKKYYGSAYHYPFLHEFNKDVIGDDPNVIKVGTVIKIPKLPEDKK